MSRRFACNMGNLVDDANNLVQTAPYSRRPRQVVNAQRITGLPEVISVKSIDFFLKPKLVVVKNLHEHHGTTSTPVCIWIALTQDVHDRFPTELRIDLQASKELLRQTPPSGEALPANYFNLLIIKTAFACRAILRLNFLLQDRAIFEKRAP